MGQIFRMIGRRGRTTVPYVMRKRLGMEKGDIVSYTLDGDAVIVRKEKICGCKGAAGAGPCNWPAWEAELAKLLAGLTPLQLQSALIRMTVHWAEMEGGGHAKEE